MANSDILHYDGSALSVLNASQKEELFEEVLTHLSTNLTSSNLLLNNSSGTLIGSFVDTSFQGLPGTSDTTILSTTYNLYQPSVPEATVDAPSTVYADVTGSTVTLQETNDSNIAIATEALNYAVNIATWATGSLYLGAAAPADGGTWVSIATITDTIENASVINQTYYIWKKTAPAVAPTTRAPLRNDGTGLTEFTSTQITDLAKAIEDRVAATGIGTYSLSTNAPADGGTWKDCGTITDIRHSVTSSSVGYIATFSGSYGSTIEFYVSSSTANVTYFGPGQIGYTGGSNVAYYGPAWQPYVGPGGTFYGPPPADYFPYFTIVPNTALYYGPSTSVGYVATVSYTGPGYLGAYYGPQYQGPSYSGATYTGTVTSIDSATETISTLTLWRKVT